MARCKRNLSIIAAVGVMVCVVPAQAQTTWYVDEDAPGDLGPGDPTVSDPLENGATDHPFDAIQEGIYAATNGDTVVVRDGIYLGYGNRDIDFGGKAITVRSENGADACIIDCQNVGRGFYFHSGETDASVVDGFTIENGNASYGFPGNGGGILCVNSSPTLTNCTLSGNSGYHGGGMYNGDGSPTLTNCTFTGNMGYSLGGGMYNGGSPTLTGTDIFWHLDSSRGRS